MTSRGRDSHATAMGKMLYFIFLTVVLGYAGMKVIPPVVTSFRFAQAMQEEVLHGAVNEPASTIHLRLLREAETLGLDVTPESIVVQKRGARLDISARYLAHIELLGGFVVDWPLDQRYEGTRRPPAIGRQGP